MKKEGKQKKLTQCERILDYIRRYGSITSWQAYADLSVTQLGARIYGLKEQGYVFKKERVYTKNRMGEDTHYDKYMLVEEITNE